jgi:hypothetical protein
MRSGGCAGLGPPGLTGDPVRLNPSLSQEAMCVADIGHDATLLVRELPSCPARDKDEVEWQGGRVYLHLGARPGRPPRGYAGLPKLSTAASEATTRQLTSAPDLERAAMSKSSGHSL